MTDHQSWMEQDKRESETAPWKTLELIEHNGFPQGVASQRHKSEADARAYAESRRSYFTWIMSAMEGRVKCMIILINPMQQQETVVNIERPYPEKQSYYEV